MSTTTVFGVTNATLAFNAPATRFAVVVGNSAAGGSVTYGDGSCTFTVGASTFASGTGLGLYIARELCAANGASLEYLDRGSGADFRILWQEP